MINNYQQIMSSFRERSTVQHMSADLPTPQRQGPRELQESPPKGLGSEAQPHWFVLYCNATELARGPAPLPTNVSTKIIMH